MDSFLLKFHACISPKAAKYLQNPEFSRKLHHDSPSEGTKTSNLYRSVELYRMDLFLLKFHACISLKLRNTSKIPGFLENCTTILPVRGPKPQTYTDRWSSMSSIEWTHFYSNSMLSYPPKLRNTSKISDFLDNSTTIRPLREPKPQTYTDQESLTSSIECTIYFFSDAPANHKKNLKSNGKNATYLVNPTTTHPLRGRKPQTYIDR